MRYGIKDVQWETVRGILWVLLCSLGNSLFLSKRSSFNLWIWKEKHSGWDVQNPIFLMVEYRTRKAAGMDFLFTGERFSCRKHQKFATLTWLCAELFGLRELCAVLFLVFQALCFLIPQCFCRLRERPCAFYLYFAVWFHFKHESDIYKLCVLQMRWACFHTNRGKPVMLVCTEIELRNCYTRLFLQSNNLKKIEHSIYFQFGPFFVVVVTAPLSCTAAIVSITLSSISSPISFY